MSIHERMLMADIPKDCKKDYCCYCGMHIIFKRDRTIEHLVPKSKGGTENPLNKRPCCPSCNGGRASKSLDYWVLEIEREYEWMKTNCPYNTEVIRKLEVMIANIKYWHQFILDNWSSLTGRKSNNPHYFQESPFKRRKHIV